MSDVALPSREWLLRQSEQTDPRAERLARVCRKFVWAPWLVFTLAVCWSVARNASERTVTPVYFTACAHWFAGKPLYNDLGTGFLYLPQMAILFAPFDSLPAPVGDLLWRVVTIGCYGWGLFRLASLAERNSTAPLFGVASLIAIPLAWASARNGQATLPLAGLMMASVADIADRRWWRAALWLTFALAIKPLAIVLLLLGAALYPALIGRLAVTLVVMAVVPFLTQDRGYVVSQYQDFVQMLRLAQEYSNLDYFAQPFGMLRLVGIEVDQRLQTIVRATFGLATLGVCYLYSRRLGAAQWSLYFYGLATCYLMLFNPRTENNTYSMLAPAVGILLAQAMIAGQALRFWTLCGIAAGLVGCHEIARLVTSPKESIWLAPLMALALAGLMLRDLAGAKLILVETVLPAPARTRRRVRRARGATAARRPTTTNRPRA